MKQTQCTRNAAGIMVLAGTLLVFLAGPGMAAPAAGPRPGAKAEVSGDKGQGPFLGGLGLSPQQIALLKADRSARQKKMIQWRADIEVLRVDIREAASQDKVDLAKIEGLAGKIGALRAKMIVDRVKGLIYLRGVLTPEQKKLLDERLVGGMPHPRWRPAPGRPGPDHAEHEADAEE